MRNTITYLNITVIFLYCVAYSLCMFLLAFSTLDYVFVSHHWSVQQPTTVLPKVDLHGSVPTIPAAVLTSLSSKREAVMVSMPAAAAVEGEQLPVVAGALLQQVLTAPQPTLQWPSDHFIVYASLDLA